MKTYALIGRSGTGKSFRAQYIASKYHIHLIIDDGLLIKGDKILAGRSAKQDQNFITALKTALFQDEEHFKSVIEALEKEKVRKILILGTSEKMIFKIASRLNLAPPTTLIHIEDIATQDEIDTAMRIRFTEGRHVIPVPPIQVTRSYSTIVYDSIKVAFKKGFFQLFRKQKQSENTLVKPEFSKQQNTVQYSNAAISQMITQCLYEYGNVFKVEEVDYTSSDEGYLLKVVLRTPSPVSAENQAELKEYISDSLEKYGGLLINRIELEINLWKNS